MKLLKWSHHANSITDRLIEALVNGGEQLRKTGETALALRYFRFAFDNEPTREDVCYLLMLTLWKLGRHGEALNEYFVCRRALVDRFGIEGTAKIVSSMMRFLPTLLDSVVSLWKRARTSCLFDAQVGLLCEKAYNVTDQMSA